MPLQTHWMFFGVHLHKPGCRQRQSHLMHAIVTSYGNEGFLATFSGLDGQRFFAHMILDICSKGKDSRSLNISIRSFDEQMVSH